MDKILTAADVQGVGVERFTAAVLRGRRQNKPMPKELAEVTVQAEINHGRWIVKCPFCAGAEMAEPNDKRFYCLSCFNEQVGGKWLLVEFPKNPGKIEIELLKRSKKQNRNWTSGETAKNLQDENKKQDI